MRLLHLADRLTDRGGAYRHLLAILAALAKDHELLLAVGADDGTARAPCRVAVVPGLGSRVAQATALDAVVAGFPPDVVHVHNVMNPEVLCWASARGDAILTVQDHRYFCPTRGKWTTAGSVCRERLGRDVCAPCFVDGDYFEHVYSLTEARLAFVHRLPVVVLSRYMQEELTAAGVPRANVRVIPPFVEGLDLAAGPDGPPCVLFVGRLVEGKGLRDAVAAWRRSGVDLPLVVAGSGPLRAEIAEPGLQFLGWVEHARLAPLYRRARALLLPSRWQEPFGLVGLEALSFGVPVVAWESGGVREWHPGEGLLVGWGDVDGLGRALREAVGRRAAAPAGFRREALMERLVDLYAETVVHPSAPALRG